MVEDIHFKGEKLYSLVNNIIFNDNRLKEMSKNSKKLANINASENIADIIEQKAGE